MSNLKLTGLAIVVAAALATLPGAAASKTEPPSASPSGGAPQRTGGSAELTAERLAALPNSRQGFTARLPDGGPDVTFSVILTFASDADATNGTTEANLELLVPDLLPEVVAALTPGRHLTVFSGARPIAECEILSPAGG